jgi:hypothetical protein
MHLVDKLRREAQAPPAARGLAETPVNLARAAQALRRRGADFAVPMTVADANVHAGTIYE